MITYTYAAMTRYACCLAVGVAIVAMNACGGGNAGKSAAALSIISADSNVPIKSGATLSGLSKIVIAGTGSDAADLDFSEVGATFDTAQDGSRPLVRDEASPGEYWLPIVLTSTSGTLSVSMTGAPPIAIPLTLTPFKTTGVPGAVTRAFLEASLSNTNAALKDLLAGRPLPDLLQALTATTDLTQQQLTWVTTAMHNGTVIMAARRDGTPVSKTTDDLKALDQIVSRAEALRLDRSSASAVASLSPWRKVIDLLVPSAVAQTTNSTAFINGMKATGDGLALTAGLALYLTDRSVSAYGRSTDTQAVALNMAGLYAAHYGNAQATLQTLPNLTFTGAEPVAELHLAVFELLAGVVNEIIVNENVLPGLDNLAQDSAVGLVSTFISSVNKVAVENIAMDQIMIYKAHSVGIALCASGEMAVADPDIGLFSCASL
jgi:hypothetical protein